MARWKHKTHLFRPDDYVCSSCGTASEKPYEICPACRAHMKNVKYDPSWVNEVEELSALVDEDW